MNPLPSIFPAAISPDRFGLEIFIEADSWAGALEILREEARRIEEIGPGYAVAGGGQHDHRDVRASRPVMASRLSENPVVAGESRGDIAPDGKEVP